MPVRVRFAPSPTGYLHIGGLRTALYNYLFAKNQGGTLILRIEDTDRSRFVENATENLIASLRWAGIEFDESPEKGGDFGPYIQSERLSIYSKHAQILIDAGAAYYAFDSAEEIELMRSRMKANGLDPKYDRMSMKNSLTLPDSETKDLISSGANYVIRLKIPSNENIIFTDIIRGEVSVPSRDIDDQVLLKSDGFPTYHLANVVDDYLMKITHVIRGEEWLPSTPKHVLLYRAFGWEPPEFAHLPLLLNKDKSKLSKRQGDVAMEDYIQKGYFKEAIVNFVALLGWNPTADKEVYEIDELIANFNLKKVNKGGAVFDIQKLDWFNFQYLKQLPIHYLTGLLLPIIENNGLTGFSPVYLEKVIVLMRERVNFLHEIPDFGKYFFIAPKEFESEYIQKHWKEQTSSLLKELLDIYKNIEDFSHQQVHDETMKFLENKGIKLKDFIHPLRVMITGKSAGAGMFETMEVLGKTECLQRIVWFLQNQDKFVISQ